jgi:pilus assembly protein Flp/PilA
MLLPQLIGLTISRGLASQIPGPDSLGVTACDQNFTAAIWSLIAPEQCASFWLNRRKLFLTAHQYYPPRGDDCCSTGVYRMSKVLAFLKDEAGATAIEYGLIAAGISVVIIATVNTIGTTLNGTFNSISTQLK